MKRPNGITPPTAPPEPTAPAHSLQGARRPAGVEDNPAPSAAKQQSAKQPPAKQQPAKQQSAKQQPAKQPVRLIPAGAVEKTPSPTVRAQKAPVVPNEPRPATATPSVSPSRTRADEALARRNVRIAEQKRRRYERSEARRFTERSRRRRLTWLVSLGAVVLLVLVVVAAAYSPLFAVRTISVAGTDRIDASQVEAALGSEVGSPLALVDYSTITNELSAFPLIQSYSTEAQLPNTLVIRIVERQPVGVTTSGTGFDLIDPAGIVVQHLDARPAGYPLIDTAAAAVGSPGFLAATSVLRSLPADLLGKVDAISAATPDSVTLTLTGVGQKVIWGSASNFDLKARVLDKLVLTQDPDSSLTYDVSSPESPVVE